MHRVQPTIHVTVLLVSLVQTVVQTSASVQIALALMVVLVPKGMGRKLAVFVLKDLMAQVVMLIFHSVMLTHVLMVVHALKDLGL